MVNMDSAVDKDSTDCDVACGSAGDMASMVGGGWFEKVESATMMPCRGIETTPLFTGRLLLAVDDSRDDGPDDKIVIPSSPSSMEIPSMT